MQKLGGLRGIWGTACAARRLATQPAVCHGTAACAGWRCAVMLPAMATPFASSPAVDTALPADWLIPAWPAPPGVHALCTTRTGGVSAAPYDSLNLGDHVGDSPDAVQANRP